MSIPVMRDAPRPFPAFHLVSRETRGVARVRTPEIAVAKCQGERSRWLLSSSAEPRGRYFRAAVVMVQAVKNGARDNLPLKVQPPREGQLLGDALMWPGLVVEAPF